MNYRIKEEIFDGILTAALDEYIDEFEKTLPSDEELAKMYPISKKSGCKYKRIAKAKKHTVPLPIVYLGRTAVIFLTIISLAFGLLITNTNVRAAVTDTVVEWYEKYIRINFGNSSDEDTNEEMADVGSLTIGYIPEGFELADVTEKDTIKEYLYTAEDGRYILVGIYVSETGQVSMDIENVEYSELSINGNDAYMSYDDVEQGGTITFGNNKYTVSITAAADKEELIKIAQNIK